MEPEDHPNDERLLDRRQVSLDPGVNEQVSRGSSVRSVSSSASE